MKIRQIVVSALATGLLLAGFGCATEREDEGNAAQLESAARINRAEAEKIALAQVPGGTIKEGGIEKEKGKVLWSFDIASPGTKDITEVQVDSQTGKVLAVDKETPADEAKEKKKKGEKEDDDEKDEKK